MDVLDRVIVIGIPGFLVCTAFLLGVGVWQRRETGRKDSFRVLPVIGLSLVGGVWMVGFILLGFRRMFEGRESAGQLLCFLGIFGSIGIVTLFAALLKSPVALANENQPTSSVRTLRDHR